MMSCIGVMYQPYNSSTHYVPSPTPACPLPSTLASPTTPISAPTTSPAHSYPDKPMKREITEKDGFKIESEVDMSRIQGDPREPAYSDHYPTPREPFDSRETYPSPRDPYVIAPADGRDPTYSVPTSEDFQRSSQEYPGSQEYSRRDPYHSPPEGIFPSPTPHTGSTGGSCGAQTPTPAPLTPVTPSPNSQNESEVDEPAAPVYLARNVVVYTAGQGDVGSLVDMHFTKALNQADFNEGKVAPMASRNLPPSFFNANYNVKTTFSADLYPEYASLQHLAAHASAASHDPWQYAAQASSSSYHRSMQDLYSRGGAGYSLFLNSPRLPVKTETPWGGGEYVPSPAEFPHSLDRGYPAHNYSNMTAAGLESGVGGGGGGGGGAGQEGKDVYWPTF